MAVWGITWEKVVETAKSIYKERENYAYFYGAKGQVLTGPVMDTLIASEAGYFARRYTDQQIQAIKNYSVGKIGLDCSGFVCYVLEKVGAITRDEWTYSTALIGRCAVQRPPLEIPAAGILYRCPASTGRHVGIDIDHGKFLHMAREGCSIEMGDNHGGYWEIGGCYPAIDYSTWHESSATQAEALETMWVRSAPAIQAPAVGTVIVGDRVTVLETLENGWLRIAWNGGEAYTSNVGGRYYVFWNE